MAYALNISIFCPGGKCLESLKGVASAKSRLELLTDAFSLCLHPLASFLQQTPRAYGHPNIEELCAPWKEGLGTGPNTAVSRSRLGSRVPDEKPFGLSFSMYREDHPDICSRVEALKTVENLLCSDAHASSDALSSKNCHIETNCTVTHLKLP